MKKKIIKSGIILGIVAAIIGMIAFYVHYNSIEEYTKRRLKEEYGEEFEIKTVYKDGCTTVAYPVNDPELLFGTYYIRKNGSGSNGYIQEIIARQFRELIEEKLKSFEYEYYVDVNMNTIITGMGTDATIKEFNQLFPDSKPSFRLYLSSDYLSWNDDKLYSLLDSIVNIHSCGITVYFINNDDFEIIKKDFSTSPTMSSDTHHYLQTKYKAIHSSTNTYGEWNMNLAEFNNTMMEVRSNGLFR